MQRNGLTYVLHDPMAIIMLAFTSQFIAIPTYHQLENHSQEGFAQKSCAQYIIYIIVFIAVGMCGVLLFGKDVDVDLMISLGTHP